MKHAVWWTGTLGLVGVALGRPTVLAAHPKVMAAPKVTIIWVNPRHVTSTDRVALTRLLTDAVSGKRLPGYRIRDSRLRVTIPDCLPATGRHGMKDVTGD